MKKKVAVKPRTNNDKRTKLKKENKLQFTWLQAALKSLRKEAGLTLPEAGAKLGIGKVRMWQIENKEDDLTWSLVMRVLKAYGASPSRFFKDIPDFVGQAEDD